MILTQTIEIGGKGLKKGVSQSGKAWKLQSFKAFPFENYVSVMLPDFVHEGMIITVSGTVKKEEKGGYTNYSLQHPVIDTLFRNEKAVEQVQQQPTQDPFAGGESIDIDDDSLPF